MIMDLWQLFWLNLAIRYSESRRSVPYGERLIEAIRANWSVR